MRRAWKNGRHRARKQRGTPWQAIRHFLVDCEHRCVPCSSLQIAGAGNNYLRLIFKVMQRSGKCSSSDRFLFTRLTLVVNLLAKGRTSIPAALCCHCSCISASTASPDAVLERLPRNVCSAAETQQKHG